MYLEESIGLVLTASKNLPLFDVFEFKHDAMLKMCQLEFRFQNLGFAKSAGTKCAVFM